MDDKNENKHFHVKDLLKKIEVFLSEDKPSDVLIIKSHLLCEYYINQVLIFRDICLAHEIESLTFHDKLQKAFDLKNPSEKKIFDFLIRLNKLRNKVGHELEYTLSESDVDSLGYVHGKDYIIDKYNYGTNPERLRDTLTKIVVQLALLLISEVETEKEKRKKVLPPK